MSDRIKFDDDGDQLDEIVLTGVTVHMERMSHHGWWMVMRNPETGESVDLWWQATAEPVVDDAYPSVKHVIHGPLGCHGPPWIDRKGGDHRCDVDKFEHVRCRCECGATKAKR